MHLIRMPSLFFILAGALLPTTRLLRVDNASVLVVQPILPEADIPPVIRLGDEERNEVLRVADSLGVTRQPA